MKIFSKKVKLFGKQISAVALALIAIAGLASAGLLRYYGMITGTATVEQSVKLDGRQCGIEPGCELTENVIGVAGTQIDGDVHSLTNANPNIDAIVSLDSTITECAGGFETDGTCAGLTVTPKFRLDAVEGQANDDLHVIPPTTTWSDFSSVSFDYLVTDNSTYEKTPHVNIALRDPSTGEFKCLIVSSEKDATKGVWESVTFTKSELESAWRTCNEINDSWVFNSVTIEVADGAGKITSEQVQTVWVKNIKVNGVDKLWFRVPNSQYGNEPARTVHFKMGYDFAMDAYPGNYIVETKVTPRGTYTQGGVYTPG